MPQVHWHMLKGTYLSLYRVRVESFVKRFILTAAVTLKVELSDLVSYMIVELSEELSCLHPERIPCSN